MADKITLSEGALRLIMSGGDVEDPIIQVLGSKRIASGSAEKERFRLLLSDGKYVISLAMLSREINHNISRELATNTIIKIKNYVTSTVNSVDKGNKRVLVILEMEALVPGEKTSQIGNPVQLPEDDMKQNAPVTNASIRKRHNRNGHLNVPLLDHLTHPISTLNPCQNKWVIKARVINKIKTLSDSHGEGRLFSMDLIDESGGIHATVPSDIFDKFYLIKVNRVYYISKCILKAANKQFTTLRNDYEMIFTNDTIVQECHNIVSSRPETQKKCIAIETIAPTETETLIADKIGVCKTTSATMQDQLTETNSDIQKIIQGNKNNSEVMKQLKAALENRGKISESRNESISRLQKIISEMNSNMKKIIEENKNNSEEIKQLRAAIENKDKVIESQNENIGRLQEKIEKREIRINSLEKETKKRNLICYDVEEKSQENKKRRKEHSCSW